MSNKKSLLNVNHKAHVCLMVVFMPICETVPGKPVHVVTLNITLIKQKWLKAQNDKLAATGIGFQWIKRRYNVHSYTDLHEYFFKESRNNNYTLLSAPINRIKTTRFCPHLRNQLDYWQILQTFLIFLISEVAFMLLQGII